MKASTIIPALAIAAIACSLGTAHAQTLHQQETPTNFGLRRPLPKEVLPYSKVDVVWPERTPKKEPAPVLRPVSGNVWSLEGGWELSCDGEEWYDATVPGTVLTTLVQQGVYPDPRFGVNNMVIPEDLCRKEWTYTSALRLTPEQLSKESIKLIFEGINYRAEVRLNGKLLGTIDGAFIRGSFEIKGIAKEDNNLSVRIFPPYNPGFPHEQSSKTGSGPNGGVLCLDGPTFISSEGWDWVPGVRDRNIGIWQPVLIKTSDGVEIGDSRIVTDLPLPDVSKADIIVETSITNSLDVAKTVCVRAKTAGQETTKTVTVPSKSSVSVKFDKICVSEPELWWPNGYGKQSLYDMEITASVSDRVSDSQSIRYGIREFSYELTVDTPRKQGERILFNPTAVRGKTDIFDNRLLREVGEGVVVPSLRMGVDESSYETIPADGTSPYLVIRVNGKRIFCKGGNWGMDDMMKNTDREHLAPYFKLHKEAGFNIVRNWTGESTEESFYSLCDEYGMLVWNDFWLSTEGWNLDVNDELLFMENATDVVRRFRNHPSIAIWCPRNEGYATESLEKDITAMLCAEDGTRFYSPNSRYCNLRPSGPWHYRDAAEYFTTIAGGFSTELGSPSIPTARSIRKFMAPEDLWPIGEVWYYHDRHVGNEPYIDAAGELYGEPTDLDDFCKKIQLVNYDSYRAMFESWNSRMWNNTSGMMIWMSHPAWPSVEWQSYSWDYETHGSWFGCKKALEPLHVQMNADDDMVCIVNNETADADGLAVSVLVYGLDGRLRKRMELGKNITAPSSSLTNVARPELPRAEGVTIARVQLTKGGKVISQNDYLRSAGNDFRALGELAHVEPAITRVKHLGVDENGYSVATFEIVNRSKTPAMSIKLNLLDADSGEQILPALFSDGYFHLMPGEKRNLSVKYRGTPNIRFSTDGYN